MYSDLRWAEVALRELFPHTCGVSCNLVSSVEIPELLPEVEWLAVKHCVILRKLEFAAGRFAARNALRQLGLADAVIPVRDDRSPSWPHGFVGSIAHSREIAVAVAARVQNQIAVGVDIESTSDVVQKLWPEIMTLSEIDFLNSLHPMKRSIYAAVIFSLKESFYKFQYPRTGRWMDFHDLNVFINLEDNFANLTSALPVKIGNMTNENFIGHFRVTRSTVLTAISA